MNKALLRDKIEGSLWGIFIGDALSMPVHWYYNPQDIVRDFGKIDKYYAPKSKHPSSIMNLHSTGKGGRGAQKSDIVGRVILKGKQGYWGQKNMHYHQGMKAGENTLNAWCTRILLKSISEQKKYDSQDFLKKYADFMTQENSHPDTYAESYHRDFFSNFDQGKKLDECAGKEGHDTPSMGGLVTLPPVIIASLLQNPENIKQTTKKHLFLTHKSESLSSYAQLLQELFQQILMEDKNVEDVVEYAQQKLQMPITKYSTAEGVKDTNFIGQVVSSACYIDGSFPALLFLYSRYGTNIEKALLANANAGGENCHRGAVLGSLVGASLGRKQIPQHLIDGLQNKNELQKEINTYLDVLNL